MMSVQSSNLQSVTRERHAGRKLCTVCCVSTAVTRCQHDARLCCMLYAQECAGCSPGLTFICGMLSAAREVGGNVSTLANVTTFNVTTGPNPNYPSPPAWGLR